MFLALAAELLTHAATKTEEKSAADKLVECVVAYPNLLERVLISIWEQNNNSQTTVGNLLRAALSSSSAAAPSTEVALQFFREHISESQIESGGAMNVQSILEVCVPLLRSSQEMLTASALPELTTRLCESAAASEESENIDLLVNYATACFPVRSLPPPIPRWASENDDASSVPLTIGTAVWYRHRDGNWEAAEISSIDISIEPPSYGVILATGVRETEKSRLRIRKSDEPPPLSVPTTLGSVTTGRSPFAGQDGGSFSRNEKLFIAEHAEKAALLQMFRNVLCVGSSVEARSGVTLTGNCMPLVLSSAVAWCSNDFTQADWDVSLSCLQTRMEAAAEGMASADATIAERIANEAEIVAGGPLGSPEASLTFFRRLNRKGLLESSEKGVAAGCSISNALVSALDTFLIAHGTALIALLQTYCHVAHVVPTARTLPFMLWESSQAAVCAAVLDSFISLGKIVALSTDCGQGSAVEKALHQSDALPCWLQLSVVVDATVAAADRAFLKPVVDRSNARIASDGVGCTDALVALALDPGTPHAARDAAYRSSLLHSELILDLVRGSDDDSLLIDDSSSPAVDWCDELERAGVVSAIATSATACVAGTP